MMDSAHKTKIFYVGECVGRTRKAGGKVTGTVKKICFAGGLEWGSRRAVHGEEKDEKRRESRES